MKAATWMMGARVGVLAAAAVMLAGCEAGSQGGGGANGGVAAKSPPVIPAVTEKTFAAPHGMKLTVRMVAPYAADTDLQMICVFKHNPGGDKYIEAMQDFDDKLGGVVSALRNRGEFVGELGETILVKTWPGSITPKRVMLIGLGDEGDLSLDTLRVVGRVAAREAVKLKASRVAWAPTIRDQGNSKIEVGEGDRAAAEAIILAYDTEIRLQDQGLAPAFRIDDFVIEAGPAFVTSAIRQVGEGVETAKRQIGERSAAPYRRIK